MQRIFQTAPVISPVFAKTGYGEGVAARQNSFYADQEQSSYADSDYDVTEFMKSFSMKNLYV